MSSKLPAQVQRQVDAVAAIEAAYVVALEYAVAAKLFVYVTAFA